MVKRRLRSVRSGGRKREMRGLKKFRCGVLSWGVMRSGSRR